MLSASIDSMPPKRITSYALTQEALDLLAVIARRKGLNKTATLETLIRDEAERDGLRAPATPTPAPP